MVVVGVLVGVVAGAVGAGVEKVGVVVVVAVIVVAGVHPCITGVNAFAKKQSIYHPRSFFHWQIGIMPHFEFEDSIAKRLDA